MSTPQRSRTNHTAVAAKSDANPEGKGSNGFLLDWQRSRPRGVVARHERQLLAELFTSMLALSARFGYRPVPGRPNYLYLVDGEWSLSLIAPQEWTEQRRQCFAGTLLLQPDMTWTLSPSDRLGRDDSMSAEIDRLYAAFVESLDSDRPFEELLPGHDGRMPYYQRLFAGALSRSIRAALSLGDQASKSGREWRAALPRAAPGLPALQIE